MGETKFTPGPWSVFVDDSGDRPVAVPSVQAPDDQDCAVVHWDGFWQQYWQSANGDMRQMHANAHLIAAAPDLYEALEALERRVVELYRAACPGGSYGSNTDGSARNQNAFADNDDAVRGARTSLAKALGES